MEGDRKFALKPNPRSRSNFLSNVTFTWTIPLFRFGFKKEFEEADLFQPLPDHDSGILGAKLEAIWTDLVKEASLKGKSPSLLKALVKCFGGEFGCLAMLLVLNELIFRVAQPIFLGLLVSYFTSESEQHISDAYKYGALVVLCSALVVWIMHPYMLSVIHLGMKIRVATCSLAYRKLLRLNKAALKETSPGQMVNLLSNDVNRFDTATLFIHYLWLGPLQTVLITGLIVYEIGTIPAVVGVMSLLIYSPLQAYFGKMASVLRLKIAKRTDERVRLMNEIISGIQVIKMYAWEIPFQKTVSIARRAEMKQIMYANHIRGVVVSFIIFATRFAIFMAMLTYALMGERISAKTVFIVTAYFNILRHTVTVLFPHAVAQLAEGLVSVRRLQDVLLLPELRTLEGNDSTSNGEIVFNNATAKWDPDLTEPTLSNLSIKISPGSLVAVVGPVGAGKSSVLNAILGELPLTSGTAHAGGKVAYAAQEPWLFAASVRQNILFGEPMDSKRYRNVVNMCALTPDFAMFPQGDQTLVGEKGVTLSGGQRARINLARALYRQADIYLLDDPLSAVDAHVSSHLFNQCISQFLSGKTRVLVTHQLQYLPNVDHIFVLNNGRLIANGSYAEVREVGLSSLMSNVAPENETSANLTRSTSKVSLSSTTSAEHDSKKSSLIPSVHDGKTLETPEQRASGAVGWRVFGSYLSAGGNICYLIFVLSMFAWCQFFASAGDYWITVWIQVEEALDAAMNASAGANATAEAADAAGVWYGQWPPDRDTCIYVYSAITVATIVATLLRSSLFLNMCGRSSCRLHDNMFASITHAKMRFFNTNTSGRILNRFSKDMGAIDEMLPLCTVDTVQIGLVLLSVMLMVAIINYWLMIPLFILTCLSLLLRNIYMATSRSLKRLEGVTRSPVFSHMNASVSGLTTVRALRMESVLISEFDRHQDLHSSAWYLFLATTRAFGYGLDQLCLIFIACVTFSFLIGNDLGVFGGNVGLAITQALSLTGMLQWGMRQEAEMENQMTSVERVLEYSHLPVEPPLESPPEKKPEPSWPKRGHIEFEDLCLYYDPDDPPVLKNLTVTFNAGEKIGIVGRTGAGKSSLIAALFRLEETQGRISIDGLDTGELGVHELRNKLSIIPQEPVLFNATLKRNLDPFDEHPDEALWSAIKEVKLQDVVDEMGSGLQSVIQEGGANLSVGLRQLVCLARAILRNNRILIMDEATANVDPHTDTLIQNMIRDKFKDCTVLTIAHRLHTIMDSDKVLVMDAGSIVEYDHPHLLLRNSNSHFHKMVLQVGGAATKNLFHIAEESFQASCDDKIQ